jgi:DNA polymerase III subunit epsilon
MKITIFDTETTGLFKNGLGRGHPEQPDMVQLAMINLELDPNDDSNNWKEVACINMLIKDQKPSEDKALETHGKTTELLQKFGVPRRLAISNFYHTIADTDILVAHNIEFDLNILGHAFALEGIKFPDLPRSFCTMKTSTDICQIPAPNGRRGYKWPKLIEAYKILVDPEGFEGAHDALADVRACGKVLKVLAERGIFHV